MPLESTYGAEKMMVEAASTMTGLGELLRAPC